MERFSEKVLQKQFHVVNILGVAEQRLQSNFNFIIKNMQLQDLQIIEGKAFRNQTALKLQILQGRVEELERKAIQEETYKKRVHDQFSRLESNITEVQQSFETKIEQEKIEQRRKQQWYQRIMKELKEQDQLILVQERKLRQKYQILELEIKQIKSTYMTKQNANSMQIIRSTNQICNIKYNVNEALSKINLFDHECKSLLFQLSQAVLKVQLIQQQVSSLKQFLINQIQQKSDDTSNQIKQLLENHMTKREPLQDLSNSKTFITSQIKQDNGVSSYNKQMAVSNEDIYGIKSQIQKIWWFINEMQTRNQKRMDKLEKFPKDAERNEKSNKKERKYPHQLQQKINSIKPEILKLWSKVDTLDDKILFFERKLEEKNKQISQITEIVKETQSFKLEQKIKQSQTQIFANLKQIRAKIDSKVNLNDYQKFSKLILDKILQLNEQMILKSDKIEVKKALLFIESKIKQIILVISEEEENEKDALITKKQIKCISCDKDIQKFLGTTTNNYRGNWDGFPYKQHSADILGKFGMTGYGSLSRKLKRLQNKDGQLTGIKRSKDSLHSQIKIDQA